ncbi:MAG: hypothetical protein ACR2LQ_02420 [Acidimicrobiales bacterium]
MDVRSDRRYRFGVEPAELWSKLTSVEDYRSWWPWLVGFDAGGFQTGERWACVVQPPLPYSLRFDLVIGDVIVERSVTATIEGDIIGHARLDLAPSGEGSDLRLTSQLAPSNAMLRVVARIAKPVVRFGHDWVIDTGLRQFEAHAF